MHLGRQSAVDDTGSFWLLRWRGNAGDGEACSDEGELGEVIGDEVSDVELEPAHAGDLREGLVFVRAAGARGPDLCRQIGELELLSLV